jgi:hypothetical protein
MYFYSNYENKKRKEQIKSYKGETIGLATKIKLHKNGKDLNFYFYNNKKRFLSKIILNKHNNYTINKFYKVTYDKNNPKNNFLHIKTPLEPDSISLVKAGFTYKKIYEHDYRTDTYKLKYEWK